MRRVAIWLGMLSVSGWLAGAAVFAQEGRPGPEEIFERLDQNGDGKIKSDEVPEPRRPMFDRLLERGDENGDGALSRDEFVKAFAGSRGERRPGAGREAAGRPGMFRGARVFEMLDQNKDGVVTKDEVPERFRERVLPLFERLNKEQLTREDLAQLMGGGPGGPPFEMLFRRLDRNGDGKISRDEVPERAKRFLDPIFERTGKDELTPEDLAQLRPPGRGAGPQFGGRGGPRGFGGPGRFGPRAAGGPRGFAPPRISEKIDTNRDGKISREELERAVSKFDELDADGDGQLDLRELFGAPGMSGPFHPGGSAEHGAFGRRFGPGAPDAKAAPSKRPGEHHRPRPEDRAKRLIERFDQNGDGAISEDEAPDRLKERFSKLDRNGDGKIDAEELQHHRGRKGPREKGPQ
ncbi:MAG: hypothetical protein GXP27_12845 [Planctomycetes bacterium]|nr:hypothetical protein [Planctomycetota bacterium]